jgi:hypothetical protein
MAGARVLDGPDAEQRRGIVMKVQLMCRNVRRSLAQSCILAAGLQHLAERVRVERVVIVLERIPRNPMPFRVRCDVRVAGPDLSAVAMGHTLESAILRAQRLLDAQIRRRQLRQRLNRQRRLKMSRKDQAHYLEVRAGHPRSKCPDRSRRKGQLRFVIF